MNQMVAAIRPVLVGVLGLAALSGCDVRPTQRSLVDAETVMTLRSDVAETRLSLAAASGEVGSVGVESHLAPPGQESLFRQAEVAPSKVAETRALLSDLGAQEGVDRSIRFNLPADILFDFDKATLRTDTSAALEKTARLVMNYPNAPLLVAGHTDAKGDDAYNIALSKRRADTVAKWLTAKTGRGVKTQGIGESQPVASNARADGSDDPDGRQRNRRVEVIMLPSPI